MIESKDIRSTNLVYWNRHDKELDNEIVEIYNVQRSSIRVYTKIEELQEVLLRYEDIEGIPLTEEWWGKLGYEWNQKHCTWTKGKIVFTKWNGSEYYLNDSDDLIIILDYVHQLQNLSYDLGEELQINE